MLLAEAGVLERSDLLGIDCRLDAVRRARAGVFSDADLAGIDARRKEAFFRPAGTQWEVVPALRKRVRWSVRDLLVFDARDRYDLILFRNVSIYFNEKHGADVWRRLCEHLDDGGFIVTGKAEKPPASLPLVCVAGSIYRKVVPRTQ